MWKQVREINKSKPYNLILLPCISFPNLHVNFFLNYSSNTDDLTCLEIFLNKPFVGLFWLYAKLPCRVWWVLWRWYYIWASDWIRALWRTTLPILSRKAWLEISRNWWISGSISEIFSFPFWSHEQMKIYYVLNLIISAINFWSCHIKILANCSPFILLICIRFGDIKIQLRIFSPFQCYDAYLLKSLRDAAKARGHPLLGKAPENTGSYNSKPHETGFFCDGGHYDNSYGRFFLHWYSKVLIDHGDLVLSLAKLAFEGSLISAKVCLHNHLCAS